MHGKPGQLYWSKLLPLLEGLVPLAMFHVWLCLKHLLEFFGYVSCERRWLSKALVESLKTDLQLDELTHGV